MAGRGGGWGGGGAQMIRSWFLVLTVNEGALLPFYV